MRHVEIARTSRRADLERRVTGRFYTPPAIAERIARAAIALHGADAGVVGDPFCGDGRLVVAWLRAARGPRLRRVVLWDCDAAAVAEARARVEAELARLGLRAAVDAEVCDTFARARPALASLDVVLTNPPWELLKPDARDAVARPREYASALRAYGATLAAVHPAAASAKGKAMTGYGVNLARAGALVAASLARPGGAVGLVLPASLFADQASSPFRSELFARVAAERIEAFPAEARLFEGVDQPFVTLSARAGAPTAKLELARFDDRGPSRVVDLADRGAPIALALDAAQDAVVAEVARRHPPLAALERDARFGLRLGRELDETRIAADFAERGVPFLKGRHVFPFRIARDVVARVDPARRAIPPTVRERRLAWRDVSRPTQRRRMHVALVPPGDVTGNSLGVAFFRAAPPEAVRVLMAILSSFVFELQVRARLATAHVSQGVLRACAVPLAAFDEARDEILALVDARMATREELPALEAAIARAYGVDRDAFDAVLAAFPKLTRPERDANLRALTPRP